MSIERYYLRLDVEDGENYIHLIWAGKYGWRILRDMYECLFRPVHLFSMKEAYELKERMESGGYLNGPMTVSVFDYWKLNIFILCDWDEHKGRTKPLIGLRCDSYGKACDYFRNHYSSMLVDVEAQVSHISDCRFMEKELRESIIDVYEA